MLPISSYLELLLRDEVFEDFLLIVNYAPVMKEKVLIALFYVFNQPSDQCDDTQG